MAQIKTSESLNGIAIIGISFRFPGANNKYEFWNNLCNGKETLSIFSDEELIKSGINKELIDNPNYVKTGGIIDNADCFDANFFGYSPKESCLMDPQHRIFLECAYNCMEDAGYSSSKYSGLIGVFAGCGMNNYLINQVVPFSKDKSLEFFQTMIGNDKDFLTTRVSYKLNLKGPSLDIQTACSTSLVAVQLASQSLLNYQCDMAIAGGVSLKIPQKSGYLYHEGNIFSRNGHCRAFDADATGTVPGEGVGAVLLKRLEDAIEDRDSVYAVIKGAAVNNDGSVRAGFTAPSIDGQTDCILMAQEFAGIDAETLSYIEAHGTGTPLGDPIEIAALTKAFGKSTKDKNFCGIGSVKTNFGHLDAASGIAGLIKTALILNNRTIPPSLHFNSPNPELHIEQSPFFIVTELMKYGRNDTPFRAGVSSFGMGGTNAHVILEEPPGIKNDTKQNSYNLFTFSAKSRESLKNQLNQYNEYFFKNNHDISFSDIVHTQLNGREEYKFRKSFVFKEPSDFQKDFLKFLTSNYIDSDIFKESPIVFMFPGQGSQYLNMCREIYNQSEYFRTIFNRCMEISGDLMKEDLKSIIFSDNSDDKIKTGKLKETYITQPVLFIIEYCTAKFLEYLGIHPDYIIGHSLGEYTGACISGIWTLKDALKIVIERGRLIQTLGKGTMLSVRLPEHRIKNYLKKGICLAAVNTQENCVVSGDSDIIKELSEIFIKEKVYFRRLETSHAFHSEMLDAILPVFKEVLNKINFNPLQIPIVSNLTGTLIKNNDVVSSEYWIDHTRKEVRFAEGIQVLLNKNPVFIEVGPGKTLTTLVRLNAENNRNFKVLNTLPPSKNKENSFFFLYKMLGEFWESGKDFKRNLLLPGDIKSKRVHLPVYMFDRFRFWIESENEKNNEENANIIEKSTKPGKVLWNRVDVDIKLADIWRDILGVTSVSVSDNFFELGGHSILATQLIDDINQTFSLNLSLRELFINPDLNGMSELVYNKHKTDYKDKKRKEISWEFPVLFPVQPKGNNTPLFLVAGAHEARYFDNETMKSSYEEDFFRYLSNILKYLGTDQPVYSFRPKGLVMHEKPHRSVEKMAGEYISKLKKYQPKGPYLIGGECVGGIVAYEIAQKLQQNGDKVRLLILLDTYYSSFFHEIYEVLYFFFNSLRKYLKKKNSILKEKGFFQLLKIIKMDIQFALRFLYPFSTMSKAEKIVRMGSFIYLKTLSRYRPEKYSGKVALIVNETWHNKKSRLGWDKKTIPNSKYIVLPGDHMSRLTIFGSKSGKILKEVIDNSKIC